MWENGQEVRSATIGWDETRQELVIQRYKEQADEYRYFPEPDLPRIHMPREWVDEQRAQLVELPDEKRKRFQKHYKLSRIDADVIVSERTTAEYFEEVVNAGIEPKIAANWIMGELFALKNQKQREKEDFGVIPIAADSFVELLNLLNEGIINRSSAVIVLSEMWDSKESATTIVSQMGLQLLEDDQFVLETIQAILETNSVLVQRYQAGEEKLFGALMGMVMRALSGKGNPGLVREILSTELKIMDNGDM